VSAVKVVGEFEQAAVGAAPYVRLVVPAGDFSLDGRRYNLVANYIAEYSAYRFEPKDAAENLISSVFYELIEYMAGCSRREARLDIRLYASDSLLRFDLSSSFAREEAAQLDSFLREMMREDLDELYRGLLTAELDSAAGRWELGLTMVAHDYHAGLSAAIDEASGGVTLRALVRREEIDS
jgi:hypothetical protein